MAISDRLAAMKAAQEAARNKQETVATKKEIKKSELRSAYELISAQYHQTRHELQEAEDAIREAETFIAEETTQGREIDPTAKTEFDAMRTEANEIKQNLQELKSRFIAIKRQIQEEENGGSVELSSEQIRHDDSIVETYARLKDAGATDDEETSIPFEFTLGTGTTLQTEENPFKPSKISVKELRESVISTVKSNPELIDDYIQRVVKNIPDRKNIRYLKLWKIVKDSTNDLKNRYKQAFVDHGYQKIGEPPHYSEAEVRTILDEFEMELLKAYSQDEQVNKELFDQQSAWDYKRELSLYVSAKERTLNKLSDEAGAEDALVELYSRLFDADSQSLDQFNDGEYYEGKSYVEQLRWSIPKCLHEIIPVLTNTENKNILLKQIREVIEKGLKKSRPVDIKGTKKYFEAMRTELETSLQLAE
jgi:hypothetical protein